MDGQEHYRKAEHSVELQHADRLIVEGYTELHDAVCELVKNEDSAFRAPEVIAEVRSEIVSRLRRMVGE